MKHIDDLDTPALVIDLDLLERNIREMARFAGEACVRLRPMIKTHKMPEVTRMQLEFGAAGILAAKIGEAEVMVDSGVDDVVLAYPVIGQEKVRRLLDLAGRSRVTVSVDSEEAVCQLAEVPEELDVLIIIDSGLRRLGVKPEDAPGIARCVAKFPRLRLKGVATHAGHVYAAKHGEQRDEIARGEAAAVIRAKEYLQNAGFDCEVVAVGSTPTARVAGRVPGITEIRPGNYVFYDMIQVALGVVPEDRCALTVRATVISTPEPGRAVIDAGSKALALDTGAHGLDAVVGFGRVRNRPGVVIQRLSEELGVLCYPPEERVSTGQKLDIIPNHACTVVNLFDQAYACRKDRIEGVFRIEARGRMI
ncbi:MAG: alanine racemase [Bacillota bacterium]